MAVSPAADIATTMIRSLKAHLTATEIDLEALGNVGLLDWTPDCEHRYHRLMGKLQEIADLAAEIDFPSVKERAADLQLRFGA